MTEARHPTARASCELDSASLLEVGAWLQQFIMAPHAELGRSGPVCPFVEPALRQGTLVMRAVDLDGSLSLAELKDVVIRHADEFQAQYASRPPRGLQAMMIVLRGVLDAQGPLLDMTHAELKTELVLRGLMLGQFHAHCPVPGVHNPAFRPMQAPRALFALRNLALHDILFLSENPVWFGAYHAVFGSHYQRAAAVEPTYAQLYRRAAETFGLQQPGTELERHAAALQGVREPAA